MSKWYVITDMGYKEISNPPHHDHWSYDYKTDSYFEDSPHYIMQCAKNAERDNNDN